MVTIEVSAKLTLDDLIAAVETLPTPELTHFVRRIIAIQARRGIPILVDEDEQALLEIIASQYLPQAVQERLDLLRDRSREDILTPAEQAELLNLVQQVEQQDLTRTKALIDLAHKRGVSLRILMDELGLETGHA
jgi:hypothetical protein